MEQKRESFIFQVLIFIGITVYAFAGTAQAQDQRRADSKAPLHACDTLAGNPLDPGRVGNGVPTALMNPATAIPACEEAVRLYPNELRFQFQLGRAYRQANRVADALRLYTAAAEKGYAGAQNSLGVMYARGDGIPKDCTKAAFYFEKASAQGYSAAADNLRLLTCVQQV
ncbi:MAG: sel1 repeat family protein [Parcubacteria group bacterium]|nr:sel1 repeat family protein [Parcubacteria group bacterium]